VIFLLLYADDILIANQYKNKLKKLKEKLNSEFETKDLDPMRQI